MKPVAYSPFFRVTRLAIPLAALAVLLGGCSTILGFDETTLITEDGGPTNEGGGGGNPEPGKPSVVVSPTTLLLRRGGAPGQMSVTVNRNGITGDISAISIPDLPKGVTANPASLTIPDGQNTGTISLTATTTAPLGANPAHLLFPTNTTLNTQITIFIADNPGTVDQTFGTNGANGIVSNGAGAESTYNAIYVQSDGSILAGGAAAGGDGWLLDRYSADGTFDSNFNVNVQDADLPTTGAIHALTVDSTTGKIVCVGDSNVGVEVGVGVIVPQQQMTVVRVNANGAKDTSNNTPSRQPLSGTDFSYPSIGYGVATLADSSILVAGTFNAIIMNGTIYSSTGVVVHVLANGTPDPAVVTTSDRSFIGIAPAADGTFVVGGTDTTNVIPEASPYFYVARYKMADGTLDPTFGTGSGGFSFGSGYQGFGFAASGDGASYAVVGNAGNNSLYYTVGLVSPAANPQPRNVTTSADQGSNASFNTVTMQSDGLIVAAGNATTNPLIGGGDTINEARVTRIKPTNQLEPDTTFGNGGSFVETTQPVPTFNAIAIQPSSYRILVAGSGENGAVIYGLWQ
ncbi:MAG: hypothetical protein FWD73_00110 [Polyangiaceae bacterium]|nr:hypothetical protein [Polyangiaceae bacterium]